jgi:AP-1 complex subunit sigma 1/2
MNASHPDYDFSNFLRPTDFRREKSLRLVMNTLDTTLYNLRPRGPVNSYLAAPAGWSTTVTSSGTAAGSSQPWSAKMWRAIDKEMTLKDCSIYCYSPEEDPYDDEEGQIWSMNYFFFNKQRKRVCYIYLRGLSIFNGSTAQVPKTPMHTSVYGDAEGNPNTYEEDGASKRAKYWLGDRAKRRIQGAWGEDDDESDLASLRGDDEPRLLPAEEHELHRIQSMEAGSPDSDMSSARGGFRSQTRELSRSRSLVRGVSEEIAEQMDM